MKTIFKKKLEKLDGRLLNPSTVSKSRYMLGLPKWFIMRSKKQCGLPLYILLLYELATVLTEAIFFNKPSID